MRASVVLDREGDEEVNQWVQITSLCEVLHCLPKPGGLFAQDPSHVFWMTAVLSAKSERQEMEAERQRREAEAAARR